MIVVAVAWTCLCVRGVTCIRTCVLQHSQHVCECDEFGLLREWLAGGKQGLTGFAGRFETAHEYATYNLLHNGAHLTTPCLMSSPVFVVLVHLA